MRPPNQPNQSGDWSRRKRLELAFETGALRAICEFTSKAEDALGSVAAEALKRRLADLRAAETIFDLVVCKPVQTDEPRELSIWLGGEYRMIIKCNHVKTPILEDGSINWGAVTRVKVMRFDRDG